MDDQAGALNGAPETAPQTTTSEPDVSSAWVTLEHELLSVGANDVQSQKLFQLAQNLLLAQKDDPEGGLDIATLKSIVHLHPVTELHGTGENELLSKIIQRTDVLLYKQSPAIVPVLRDLGDLCRVVEWRAPLGNAGLLNTAAHVLWAPKLVTNGWDGSVTTLLRTQALRVIGNLCADTDVNRARIVESNVIPILLDKFGEPELRKLAVPAVFNICNEYEPAQHAAIEAGLFDRCLRVLQAEPLSVSTLCPLLDIVADSLDVQKSPADALLILLEAGLQGNLEIEERTTLLTLINKLLDNEDKQKQIIEMGQIDLILGNLFRTYTETAAVMDAILSEDAPESTRPNHAMETNSMDQHQLSIARKALVESLSNISALPEFTEKHQNFTDKTMMAWKLQQMMTSPRVPIAQAACLMLGNLANTEDICIRLVKDVGIHQAASEILATTTDINLLHAVLGLLRNLAIPVANKESLAMVNIIESLDKSWSMSTHPQIQLAAASLIRQLVNGCLSNVSRLLLMSAPRPDGVWLTQLHAILLVWAKTDQLSIKTEIARTITAIYREVYGRDVGPEIREDILTKLDTYLPGLEKPLLGMVLQNEYPVVRSEGWFALGLITRLGPAKEIIADYLGNADFQTAYKDALNDGYKPSDDRDGTNEDTNMAAPKPEGTKDRENALILLYKLLGSERIDPALALQLKEELLALP